MRRLTLLALIVLGLAACVSDVETDQARLCRQTLPALTPEADIRILTTREAADRRGVSIDFALADDERRRRVECRFRRPGRPSHSDELIGIILDDAPLAPSKLFFLIRFWLATADAVAADPAPLGDLAGLPEIPAVAAYGLQQLLNGAPLATVYGLIGAAYALIYGLIGRINLAFGALAAAGGYGATLAALIMAGGAPGPQLGLALVYAVFVAGAWGFAAGRWAFLPLARAHGQRLIIASVGLALALTELLRLTQGDRLMWMNPTLNQPIALARAGEFVVTTSANAWAAVAVALVSALALLALLRFSEFGRRWRAYADEPVAAQLFGVDPRALVALTFTLAGALAGVGGFVMTFVYGAVGYGAATTLTLKALAAAMVGGAGSVGGALIGGLVIGGGEALWLAAFPADYRDVAVFAVLAGWLALKGGDGS